MKLKLRFALPCLLAFVVALGAFPAHADVLYDYTGNDYLIADGTVYTTNMSMDGGFNFSSPLGDNLNNVDVTSEVNNWNVFDGVTNWNASNATLEGFNVSTDPTGAIDGWDFFIAASAPPDLTVDLESCSACGGDTVFVFVPGNNNPQFGGLNGDPGVWSGAINVTPEPASGIELALGGLALALLAFGRRCLSFRGASVSA